MSLLPCYFTNLIYNVLPDFCFTIYSYEFINHVFLIFFNRNFHYCSILIQKNCFITIHWNIIFIYAYNDNNQFCLFFIVADDQPNKSFQFPNHPLKTDLIY